MGNREIKFRAWSPTLKRMIIMGNHVYVSIATSSFGFYNADNSIDGDSYVDDSKKAILMQFTGFSNNGKEIYFDDLMSNNFGTDKEVIRQIVMHEGTIMMKRIKGKSSLPKLIPLYEWYKFNFEIIGNIYENPNE